jgi:type II secretory pathway pseudopilin PulG
MALLRPSTPLRTRQRGVSLLESLVAFVVLALGTAAVAQLQSHLRLAADVARERSEAVRLGQQAFEDLRSFAALDDAPGRRTYAGIESGDTDVAASSSTHADYRIERRIDDLGFGATKGTRVAVRWSDRSGATREVVLHSFIAGVAPAYAGSLALATGAITSAPRGAYERAPTLPLTARNLGDGRSAWMPIEGGTTALVFDNRTGAVVGRCGAAAILATRDLSADALTACAAGRWLLAAGTIRFTSATPPDAAAAREPPLATAVAIALRDGDYPTPAACFTEARKTVRFVVAGSLHLEDVAADATAAAAGLAAWDETGDRFLGWHCVVAPRADGHWSGRVALVAAGWTIGAGGGDRRVCRYAEPSHDAIIAPGDDENVGAALLGRNFLVVRGSDNCPDGSLAEAQP